MNDFKYFSKDQLLEILDKVFLWSKQQSYLGYNKHDGLNSPVLNFLLRWYKWSRIIAIQSIMRFPVNIRPLLLIPKTYNPKGLSLFTRGLLNRYLISQDDFFLNEAQNLLILLEKIRSPGDWSGICWGYHYPWQDPGFFAPTNTPNAVVTCFVCEAFLDAFRVTNNSRYLEIVGDAINFFLTDLTVLKESDDELCLGYMPMPMSMRVMDVSILIGAVLAQYSILTGYTNYRNTAERLARYVVNQQTEYHAWFYTDPPGDSHITHDNYHTGFILDALHRYIRATDNNEWKSNYELGLKFYANNHFNKDGSPRWMHDCDFPHDIHGAAQGILTFSRHRLEYPGIAENITNWTISRMYNPVGRFFYQETAFFRKKFTLLRWCNGWMTYALSTLLLNLKHSS